MNEDLDDKGLHACDDCDVIDATVESTYCPYSEELYNEKVDVYLCSKCYHERCMDI